VAVGVAVGVVVAAAQEEEEGTPTPTVTTTTPSRVTSRVTSRTHRQRLLCPPPWLISLHPSSGAIIISRMKTAMVSVDHDGGEVFEFSFFSISMNLIIFLLFCRFEGNGASRKEAEASVKMDGE
jgi:hypothetical protein